MTQLDRPTGSWTSTGKKGTMTPFMQHSEMSVHSRSATESSLFEVDSSFRQASGSKRHPEQWPNACAKLDAGQPRANVDLLDIQAQAVLLEEQSKQDHEESQKLTGQYLRQMCDTKSVRVTHACEHCRQRKAKVRRECILTVNDSSCGCVSWYSAPDCSLALDAPSKTGSALFRGWSARRRWWGRYMR